MAGESLPSNMQNFTTDSYLLEKSGSWCVKSGSIYTNPSAKFNYFNKQCGDPYTYYGYWYRRFPDQNKYLNCYNLPYKDPLLDNKYGYVNKASIKPCTQNVNYHFNQVNGGFRFFDTRINPTSGRVTLTPSGKSVRSVLK